MQKVKQGDSVIIRTGKDKGKIGKIVKIMKDSRVLVEGVNQVKKCQKPNPNAGISGGIVVKEMPLSISNIGLYNPVTKKADRIGFRFLENGNKVRYFKSTNAVVDV